MEKHYIIPHTHWDREWRYPIWQTRKLLVDFMKQLLDILDTDKNYKFFLLDGQVVPIEDFLEVCPDERERLTRHIRDGRIGIGPWYTLPDLYPIDGECLIRNLNKGIGICKQYGTHLKIGYNSFGWGQTAQFPQIYADYGFDTIICAKKVSEERAPFAEFMWEALDGTKLLTSRLGDFARANFFFNAYINTRYGLEFLSEEFSYSAQKAGLAIHHANSDFAQEDYFLTLPKKGHDWSRLAAGMESAFSANSNTLLKDSQLLLSGCDFSTPQPDLTEIIEKAGEVFPDKEFVNTNLEEYTRELHEKLDKNTLPLVKGELRDGPSCDCSGNALASRIYLKQLNKEAQRLLLHHAEPLCALSEIKGLLDYPKGFMDTAWKYLLDSHPHDSINGVTQDKTADDVENRLTQVIELGRVMTDMAAEAVLQNIDFSREEPDAISLCVINPLPRPNSGVIKVVVDTPKEAHIWSIALTDKVGSPVETQDIGISEISCPVHDLDGRPWPLYADRHELYINVLDIPPLGYKVFKVNAMGTYKSKHHYWYPMRKTKGNEIIKSDNILENEFLLITKNSNGTFDLKDKQSGAYYQELNYFEDAGDVGNYWAYYPPYENRIFNTLTSAPRVWTEQNGPLAGVVGIEHSFVLPSYGEEPLYGIGKSERSVQTVVMKIITKITLKKGERHVGVNTTVYNNVKNHRLRVGFPTGVKAKTAAASGHFTVDERPITPTKDCDGAYWKEMQTLPMQSFVDLSDGAHGLAFMSNSLIEYEAIDDAKNTVYLTLFRAMNNMIVTGWECVNRFPNQEGSQLQRRMDFSYAVYPHEGNWSQACVYAQAEHFINEPSVYQVIGNHKAKLPYSSGFMEIKGANLILSAFKKADDGEGYILRLFNPCDKEIKTDIVFAVEIMSACHSSMAEDNQQGAKFAGNKLHVIASSNKIMTYRIVF